MLGAGDSLVVPENQMVRRVVKHGMACAITFLVNAALDILAEVVEKAFSFLAPSISFGLYASAEALFLYGLYMVFFGPQHPLP